MMMITFQCCKDLTEGWANLTFLCLAQETAVCVVQHLECPSLGCTQRLIPASCHALMHPCCCSTTVTYRHPSRCCMCAACAAKQRLLDCRTNLNILSSFPYVASSVDLLLVVHWNIISVVESCLICVLGGRFSGMAAAGPGSDVQERNWHYVATTCPEVLTMCTSFGIAMAGCVKQAVLNRFIVLILDMYGTCKSCVLCKSVRQVGESNLYG